MLSIRRWGLMLTALGLSACAESLTGAGARPADLAFRLPPRPALRPGLVSGDLISGTPLDNGPSGTSSGNQTPPLGAPNWYTTLKVTANVGFLPQEQRAYGQTQINYNATNVSGTNTLVLQQGTQQIGMSSAPGQDYGYTALPKHLAIDTSLPVTVSCGLTASGNGTGTVWNTYFLANLSWTTWGQKQDSSPAQPVSQSSCDSSGNGGGGGGVVICYAIIDFNINTGEILAVTPLGCY